MSKFQPNKEQKFRDDQIYNLTLMLNKVNWKELNYTGKAWVQKEEYVYEKEVKTWHYGTFDVMDIDCIKHPEKHHKEEFIHLPTYMIIDNYASYMIHKETNYPLIVKTGYKSLDFNFPDTVKVYVTSNAHLERGESFPIVYNDQFNKHINYSVEKLSKELNKIIKELKLNYYTESGIEKNIYLKIFSRSLPEGSAPLFEFCFGPIRSLELVMIKGLQVDSSKFYHC
jgi:hypothetical protein